MAAKEYLNRYRSINYTIDAKLEQVARLRALSMRVAQSFHQYGGKNGTSDRVGRSIAKIDKLEHDIDREIDRLVVLREEIMRTISQVENEQLRTILEMRYINLMSWRKIAAKLGYAEKYLIGVLHDSALGEIEKILKK